MRLPYHQATMATPWGYQGSYLTAEASGGVTPAACIDLTVQGGKVCVNLPIVGRQCIGVPSWIPNLGKVSGCISANTKWGIPVGAKVCLKYQGSEVLCKSFP